MSFCLRRPRPQTRLPRPPSLGSSSVVSSSRPTTSPVPQSSSLFDPSPGDSSLQGYPPDSPPRLGPGDRGWEHSKASRPRRTLGRHTGRDTIRDPYVSVSLPKGLTALESRGVPSLGSERTRVTKKVRTTDRFHRASVSHESLAHLYSSLQRPGVWEDP